MQVHPFEILGITPTGDVRAIKRAYAKLLKQCRPDEDPQGYQRLREALDWALQLASSLGDAQELENGTAVANAEAQDLIATPASEVNATRATTDQTIDPIESDWRGPAELSHSLHRLWVEQGNDALFAAWPDLQHQLDLIPLRFRHEASTRFADWALERPELPKAFLSPLADYFQWGEDYRIDGMLGSQRARALGERLCNAGVRQMADTAQRARFAELLQLKRLLDARRRFAALLFAALASPKNEQRLSEALPHVLRGLRLDDFDVFRLRQTLWVAEVLRLLPLVMLLGGLAVVSGSQHWGGALALMLLSMLVAPLVIGTVAALNNRIDLLHSLLPRRWRQGKPTSGRCAASIAVVLIGCIAPPVIETGPLASAFLWVGSPLVALLLIWSPDLAWRGMLLPTAVALSVGVGALLGNRPIHPLSASFGLALAWTSAAHWIFLTRPGAVLDIYRAPLRSIIRNGFLLWLFMIWLYALIFSKVDAVLIVTLAALSLPFTYIAHALGHGARYTLATLALALAAGLLFRDLGQPWFICLLVAPIVTTVLQSLAVRLSRLRWLYVPPDED